MLPYWIFFLATWRQQQAKNATTLYYHIIKLVKHSAGMEEH